MQQKIEAIIQQHDIILFDEICVLCNGWAKFLIKYDTQAQFKLTSVQSPLGQDILRHYQMPTEQFDSMLVIKNGQAYSESTAFLKVIESENSEKLYHFKSILLIIKKHIEYLHNVNEEFLLKTKSNIPLLLSSFGFHPLDSPVA